MKRELIERIKYSPLSRVATLPLRARLAVPALIRNVVQTANWIIRAREWSNLTYDYEPIGVMSVAAALGVVTKRDAQIVRTFATELRTDAMFADRYRSRVSTTRQRYTSEPTLRFGKFLFYYMLARALRPRLIFEAGTERGLGALAICRALVRNKAEGFLGRLITVDTGSDRGDFLDGDEGGFVTRVTGRSSVDVLSSFNASIDCFLHDTLSDPEHCRMQFAALKPNLARSAVVYTSWFTEEFIDFCEGSELSYFEVVERPHNHWYRGRRVGIAWGSIPDSGQGLNFKGSEVS